MRPEIIPAIDLIDGKCVRLSEGDYTRKTEYRGDPLEVALQAEAHGITRLHLVDLDGARAGQVVNWRVLETICSRTGLRVDFGGGIQSDEDLRVAFDCGAVQVNIGSAAVKQREQFMEWLRARGSDRIILSADAKHGKIAVHGWQDQTEIWLQDFIADYHAAGIQWVTTTDISRDGMMRGPATDLYQDLLGTFPELRLIASGGVSSLADVDTLAALPLAGIIIGKALFEGAITFAALEAWHLQR
ncbi:MAG: 1-(5-phosphoribosyl)-5-[(5-phosphoribosylamino)methylideneamino] imidazole-4-carboxamide isomerase [Bacteroidia bacterium]|nr:1-(5-phosphoribosyl)-5-[(5-phosphoribosylamino)methylideneamino] imidazole-4-carboxamide isomerase [Bacteroidia bacterium]